MFDFLSNYVREATIDFTITCCISPYFNNVYDAGAIMLYISDINWIKFAFGNTDMEHINRGYFFILNVFKFSSIIHISFY